MATSSNAIAQPTADPKTNFGDFKAQSKVESTPIEAIAEIVARSHEVFASGVTKSAEDRKRLLRQLARMIQDHREDWVDALYKDVRRPTFEGRIFGTEFCLSNIQECLSNLDSWMKPESLSLHWVQSTDSGYVVREPLGSILIISPWNYPMVLNYGPIASALAAGNTCVVKPSELSPYTSRMFAELAPKYFPGGEVQIVNGAIPETTELLKHRFGKIFYTGNGRVARIIMKAAAEHLTPVALELGGKSPVIVSDDVDPAIVAKRLVWGKCSNSGQICIAPDYVLCTAKMQDELITEMKKVVQEFYGENQQASDSYGRIVNSMHFKRIKGMLDAAARENKIAFGGKTAEEDLYIEFTIIRDAKKDDPVMQDEIFGPLLPFVTVENVEEAVKFINDGEKPLALYAFAKNSATTDYIIANTSSGTTCINDVLMQITTHVLPFGGVGQSGTGRSHGKYGFDEFTNPRSVLSKRYFVEKYAVEAINNNRYPPYTESKLSMLKRLFGPSAAM